MPAAKQVVRTENGATYRLTEWLGDGMIAAVWRGVGERDRAGEQVAVKIAYPALSPTLQKQFDTEYDTLTDLLTRTKTWPSKGGKPPVPAFIHKAKLEHEEQDALVTELIQTKTLSKLVLDEDDLNRRQELLVEPAYQYAWFLDFMHNRAGIRQSDRKLGDLYWDEEQDRLIMLDWTVVEKDIERAPEDVYHFGEMWYALLLNVTPTLKLGIAASQEWERLSAAWRMVLESCLRPNRQARSTAKGLLTMLYERRRAYWRTGKELEMQGLEAWEQARDLKDLRQAERAWWLLDLAWQKGLEDAGGPAQAAGAMCKQRGQEHLRDIKDHLEYAQSDAAESALKEAQGEMSDDSDDQLRLARWRCLVNAAKKSREEKISAQFRDAAPHLTAAVAALEAGQWLKARNELKPALDNLLENSETRVILDDLGRELDLHLTLAEAVSLRENTKFADAAEKYGLAQKLLAEIAYLDALEPNIADLPYEKAKCEHLAETEAKLREAQEQLAHLVNDGNYAEARGLHDRVLPLTRGKVEARQALTDVFAPVRGLEALSQACQHPDTPPEELVKQAQDLITQFPDHTTVQREVRQVVTHLLSELEQRAQEARFIEDIDDALNLGKALQSLGESAQVVQDTLERHWQAVADLEKKRGAFKQSIEKIVKEIKEEVAPQQMAQAQQKVDKLKELAELGSNYQQTMDKLPDVDELGGQVVGRGRLMREASLQRYLNEAINALRRFMPNRAELVLNKITDITSHHPDLGTDYHIEIEFVVQEYQIQNQRPEKMLAYLASLREGLESKSLPLQGETIKRLENLWQQTTSVFVGELWNLAQPKQKRVEARLLETERYERLQIEVHKELLALLKEQKVDDLQPRLDQFDQIWRGELGKNSSLRLQLDGFVNTWNERITQAQNLGDEIHDLKMLINSAYDRYQGRVKALNFGGEMFDRMETVIVYTLPEVSFVFSKEYHYLLRRLAAGLEVGKMGLSDEQVENVFQDRNIGDWPIWKRIEKQATRGRRFFAILEEETAPYGG